MHRSDLIMRRHSLLSSYKTQTCLFGGQLQDTRKLKLLKALIREVVNGSMVGGRRFDAPGNLRYGVATTGNTGGNVLTDEENEEQAEEQSTMKAATCLIMSDDGKVLAVSRKHDPSDFGLPGGKVDEAEEPIDAAARELKEETGLIAIKLTPVFVRHDADGYTTTTFACEVEGTIETPESGIVRWVEPEILFQGSFGEYNKKLFKKLGLMK